MAKVIKIRDQSMKEKFCPCMGDPSGDCHCTMPGSEHLKKMLYFCCRYFDACDIFQSRTHENMRMHL